MGETTIRVAIESDFETIVANNLAMAAETEDRRLAPAVVREGTRRVLADPECGVYYVAEREGNVVGQLLITREWSDWRNGWFWWIQSVYVSPAARRQGVYRALHEHVEQAARRVPDTCGIRLYVETSNENAQCVYQQLGMKRTSYQFFETEWSSQG